MTKERPTFRDYTVVRRMPDENREVYLAVKGEGIKHEYVLVVVDVPEQDEAAFLEDIRRAQNVDHEAVVPVVETFPLEDGRHVVVTESVEGMTLHRLMKYLEDQGERLSDGAVFHLGLTVMDALSAAHGRRVKGKPQPIVHGQLGPHQVLVTWDGDVRVLGFGLNPVFRRTKPPRWLEAYFAPEMQDREAAAVTPRANTFTTALIMWSLLTGRPVEAGMEIESLKSARPDLKPAVAHPLDRALDSRPIKRVSSKSVVMALRRVVETADREELRWALEVCRVRCTVAEEFFPTASFPPSRSDRPADSLPPASFEDELDEDLETSEYSAQQLLEQARLVGPLPWEEKKERTRQRPDNSRRSRPPRPDPEDRVASKNSNHDGSATLPAPAASDQPPHSDPTPGRVPVLGYPAQAYPPPPPPPPGMAHAPYGRSGSDHAPSSQYPGQHFQTNHGSQPPPGSVPPSHPVPGSHYPHPYPYYAYPVHPSVPPESMRMSMPPSEAPPKHRWTVAIAVTAVMSFALGVLLASGGIEVRFHGLGGPEATAAAPASPPPPSAVPAPMPTAEQPATVSEAPDAAPEAAPIEEEEAPDESASIEEEEETPEDPATEEEEVPSSGTISASSLPPERGVLKVISPFEDAHVYIAGRMIGPVGVDLEVDCGMRFVRLGTSPLGVWFAPGQPVNIQCQNYTVVTIDKRRPDNTFRPRKKKRGQFF